MLCLRQKHSTEGHRFEFNDHDAPTILLDIPISFWIFNQRVGYKFDLARLASIEHAITFPYLLSRHVNEWHLESLFATRALRRR